MSAGRRSGCCPDGFARPNGGRGTIGAEVCADACAVIPTLSRCADAIGALATPSPASAATHEAPLRSTVDRRPKDIETLLFTRFAPALDPGTLPGSSSAGLRSLCLAGQRPERRHRRGRMATWAGPQGRDRVDGGGDRVGSLLEVHSPAHELGPGVGSGPPIGPPSRVQPGDAPVSRPAECAAVLGR